MLSFGFRVPVRSGADTGGGITAAAFALAFKGFGNIQMALFAGFGSFATLVLVTFGVTIP